MSLDHGDGRALSDDDDSEGESGGLRVEIGARKAEEWKTLVKAGLTVNLEVPPPDVVLREITREGYAHLDARTRQQKGFLHALKAVDWSQPVEEQGEPLQRGFRKQALLASSFSSLRASHILHPPAPPVEPSRQAVIQHLLNARREEMLDDGL